MATIDAPNATIASMAKSAESSQRGEDEGNAMKRIVEVEPIIAKERSRSLRCSAGQNVSDR